MAALRSDQSTVALPDLTPDVWNPDKNARGNGHGDREAVQNCLQALLPVADASIDRLRRIHKNYQHGVKALIHQASWRQALVETKVEKLFLHLTDLDLLAEVSSLTGGGSLEPQHPQVLEALAVSRQKFLHKHQHMIATFEWVRDGGADMTGVLAAELHKAHGSIFFPFLVDCHAIFEVMFPRTPASSAGAC